MSRISDACTSDAVVQAVAGVHSSRSVDLYYPLIRPTRASLGFVTNIRVQSYADTKQREARYTVSKILAVAVVETHVPNAPNTVTLSLAKQRRQRNDFRRSTAARTIRPQVETPLSLSISVFGEV